MKSYPVFFGGDSFINHEMFGSLIRTTSRMKSKGFPGVFFWWLNLSLSRLRAQKHGENYNHEACMNWWGELPWPFFWFGSVDFFLRNPIPKNHLNKWISRSQQPVTSRGRKKKKNVTRNLEKPIAVDEKFRIHVQKYT